MKLFNHTLPRILIADEGKRIRNKDDVRTEKHKPYYSTVIFPSINIKTLEEVKTIYIEEDIEEEEE